MRLTAPDTLRVLAAAGLVPAVIHHGVIGLALMLMVWGACMIPRDLGTAGWLDVTYCSALLFAAWAALLDWYVAIESLDLAVHVAATGLIGLLTWQLIERAAILATPRSSGRARVVAVALTAACTTALATLWEIGEWL